MISYNEALKLITDEFDKIKLTEEKIPLEKALGRTAAEDIIADVNLPSFDNSAVDGYGIIFNDSIKEWNLTGEISAGNFKNFELSVNDTVKIMTGAKIPAGINSVIPIEDAELSNGKIRLSENAKSFEGMNIRKKAGDIKIGEPAVRKGTFLRPRHLASAASCGKEYLRVLKKLKFAILASGDELVPVSEKPEGDKLRVSNIYSLAGEVLELNQEYVNYGFIKDDKKTALKKIEELLNSDADIIITTGGVSVGDYDYIRPAFLELGVKEIFWRAYIKPGKPAFFGIYENKNEPKLIFGLPGNPVSSQVNFKVYIKENVKRLFGARPTETIEAELKNDLRKKDKKRHFIRGFLEIKNNRYFVSSDISQSSGNLVRHGLADCLIVVEEEKINPRKGEKAICIPM